MWELALPRRRLNVQRGGSEARRYVNEEIYSTSTHLVGCNNWKLYNNHQDIRPSSDVLFPAETKRTETIPQLGRSETSASTTEVRGQLLHQVVLFYK